MCFIFKSIAQHECRRLRGARVQCTAEHVESTQERSCELRAASRVPEERHGLRVHEERERVLLGARASREQFGERAPLGRGQRAHHQVRLQSASAGGAISLIPLRSHSTLWIQLMERAEKMQTSRAAGMNQAKVMQSRLRERIRRSLIPGTHSNIPFKLHIRISLRLFFSSASDSFGFGKRDLLMNLLAGDGSN